MLSEITPVLLTYNEAVNLRRTLRRLTWAKDIVVVDSGSTDETLTVLRDYPQIRVFTRAFDSHFCQWQYAIRETGIESSWILRLDADYELTDAFISELDHLDACAPFNAYRVAFDYAIYSRVLIASLYPSNTILLRRGRFTVWDNGHTEAWSPTGPVGVLKSRIVHDDWKSVERWFSAQTGYMRRELEKIPTRQVDLKLWLRLHPPLMPLIVFFYCLFVKGLIFAGRAGIFYTLQRTSAEAVLSLMVLEQQLVSRTHRSPSKERRRGRSPRNRPSDQEDSH
jgi:glycosyltransferase involved in cell wall biosynthesis